VTVPASLPSPPQGVWQLGPLPVRAYALCILLGIVVAIWLGDRRWQARGGRPGTIGDVAAWAVPFGIVGGRLYHVVTSWQPYFGPGGHPIEALYIWQGGLGIWGAVALGGLGAYIAARRAGVLTPPLADALAPGIVLAQAIGRWGNWFNNELYGGPTTLPWGLQIHQWDSAAGHAVRGPDGQPVVLGTFHPTFLYESLWDAGTAAVLIWVDRRFRIGHGRVFALYVLLYTVGRFWIEALRVDPANRILGLRLNLWTSALLGLAALAYLIVSARLRPGREERVVRPSAVVVPSVSVADRLGTAGTADDDSAQGAAAKGEPDAQGPQRSQRLQDEGGSSVEGPPRAPRQRGFWRRRPGPPADGGPGTAGEDLETMPSRPDS
jgi:prolipoprotein diacylglyceryl transferase